MIYFIIGASASGKTASISYLKDLLPKFSIYDFDEIGVPENADKKWRHQATEDWLRKCIDEKQIYPNVCLCGQMVLGEILACPSAKDIKNVNIIFLDCNDEVRLERLEKRNMIFDQDQKNWISWLRNHHKNPQWQQHVIKDTAWDEMRFNRWDGLIAWDEVANIYFIETSHLSISDVAQRIRDIIDVSN